MFKEHTAYSFYCDGCGTQFEDCDYTIFLDDPEFYNQDWEQHGDIIACYGCRETLMDLCIRVGGDHGTEE